MSMKTTPHFEDADLFYEQLLDAHLGLSRAESEALNARLILLLANQIGNKEVLSACIAAARLVPADSSRNSTQPSSPAPSA